jgi:hypothetical protein
VPFDQLLIFCTNLEPSTLADEAFFRRIRHKIFIGYVSTEQYLEIFRRVCEHYRLKFDEQIVQKIMERYYIQDSRPLRACHPRDLTEKLLDRANFLEITPQLTYEELDLACQTYFIKSLGIGDFDQVSKEPKPIV